MTGDAINDAGSDSFFLSLLFFFFFALFFLFFSCDPLFFSLFWDGGRKRNPRDEKKTQPISISGPFFFFSEKKCLDFFSFFLRSSVEAPTDQRTWLAGARSFVRRYFSVSFFFVSLLFSFLSSSVSFFVSPFDLSSLHLHLLLLLLLFFSWPFETERTRRKKREIKRPKKNKKTKKRPKKGGVLLFRRSTGRVNSPKKKTKKKKKKKKKKKRKEKKFQRKKRTDRWFIAMKPGEEGRRGKKKNNKKTRKKNKKNCQLLPGRHSRAAIFDFRLRKAKKKTNSRNWKKKERCNIRSAFDTAFFDAIFFLKNCQFSENKNPTTIDAFLFFFWQKKIIIIFRPDGPWSAIRSIHYEQKKWQPRSKNEKYSQNKLECRRVRFIFIDIYKKKRTFLN